MNTVDVLSCCRLPLQKAKVRKLLHIGLIRSHYNDSLLGTTSGGFSGARVLIFGHFSLQTAYPQDKRPK